MADAGAIDQLLAGPGGYAGHLEALADDEERRDEDDGRVAESGQALLDRQHACRPQRERRADRHDLDRQPTPHEQHDDRRDDREGDGDLAHRVGPLRVKW